MAGKLHWKNITVRLGDLKAWAENPKFSTKAQAQRIIDSFKKFDQVQTIAVSPDLEVYDGHQRLSALLTIHGEDYQIDARQSNRNLTTDERKELVITLHSGAVGSYDWQALSGWDAKELQGWGLDSDTLKGWNNDANNLKELLNASKEDLVDAEPQIDRAQELLEKWGVSYGDLWQIGEHRLLCGDSTKREDVERVMGGERAQMLSNDPPYGMGLDTDYSKMPKTSRGFEAVIGDDKPFDVSSIREIFKDVKEQFWFGADYYAKSLGDTEHEGSWMVWDKRVEEKYDDGFGSEFELVWSAVKRKRQMLRHMWFQNHADNEKEARERVHPTQKPTTLIQELINLGSNEKDICFDGFTGSGTTLIACENLKRKGRGIEISPAYCSVILERMSIAFPHLEIKKI